MGGLRVIKRMVQMVALGLGQHCCQQLEACCEQRGCINEAAARKHILREPQGSDDGCMWGGPRWPQIQREAESKLQCMLCQLSSLSCHLLTQTPIDTTQKT